MKIITFCGHSLFAQKSEHEEKLLAFLDEKIGDEPAQMYLGGYGAFDSFAFKCCKKYKKTHPNIQTVFVSPYMTIEYQKNHLEYYNEIYDATIYPPIEKAPMKFAISHRNRYMVEAADIVIAYVKNDRGGAYAAFAHARCLKKEIFNLADLEI